MSESLFSVARCEMTTPGKPKKSTKPKDLRQLQLFFDDVKTRPRINGLCQFKRGDQFYDYLQLNERSQPTMLEITSDKKYRGPLSVVAFRRWGQNGEHSLEALTATQYVDNAHWVQIS
jgi:hypothetical protein